MRFPMVVTLPIGRPGPRCARTDAGRARRMRAASARRVEAFICFPRKRAVEDDWIKYTPGLNGETPQSAGEQPAVQVCRPNCCGSKPLPPEGIRPGLLSEGPVKWS